MSLRSGLVLFLVVLGACGEGDGGGGGGGDMATGGGILTSSACPTPSGAGTPHSGFLMADETWTAASSPHTVASTLYLRGATVTIEPCALVVIAAGADIEIGDGTGPAGAIVAHGTATIDAQGNATDVRPVIFAGPESGAHWGSLMVDVTGSLDFELVGLTGGGAQSSGQNGGGTIVAYGPGLGASTPMLRMRGVLVDSSGSYGINLQRQAAFTEDSEELYVQNAGLETPTGALDNRFPIYVEAAAVHSLPTGSYTGNAHDEIAVYSKDAVGVDVGFHDRGVPYRIRSELYLRTADHGTVNTLTIDPGVTLKFDSSDLLSSLRLGDGAGGTVANQRYTRLLAQGTAAKPIVLTSAAATPAPGDWAGIYYAGGPSSGNVMSFVTVDYAGGESTTNGFGCGPTDNDAAIVITNWRPDDAFIQSCTISNSKGSGIVSGWVSDQAGPDLKSGNTFANIGTGCEVSRWADATGAACPGMRPICL